MTEQLIKHWCADETLVLEAHRCIEPMKSPADVLCNGWARHESGHICHDYMSKLEVR